MLDQNGNCSLPFQVRWLKVNFSECYTAWIHVKVYYLLLY
jgi:hypothetical protein